jgi:hypothetical protein
MIQHLQPSVQNSTVNEAQTKQLEVLTEKWTVAAQEVLSELLKKGASEHVGSNVCSRNGCLGCRHKWTVNMCRCQPCLSCFRCSASIRRWFVTTRKRTLSSQRTSTLHHDRCELSNFLILLSFLAFVTSSCYSNPLRSREVRRISVRNKQEAQGMDKREE